MTNLWQRIMLAAFLLPLVAVLIIFVPQYNHLAFNLSLLLFCIGISFESSRIVGLFPTPVAHTAGRKTLRVASVPLVGSLPTIIILVISLQGLPFSALYAGTIILLVLVFAGQVIRTQWANLSETLPQVLAYSFIVLYPGLFFAHVSALTLLPRSTEILLVFCGAVFANDTFAYVFGRLFGRFSSHPFKVSPQKTFVGFLAGFLASIIVFVVGYQASPALFPQGQIWAFILGLLVGLSTIIGDLFESALKRSAGLKDSGTLMPGRGGLLDSLDSIMFSAPFFFYVYIYTQKINFSW